MKTKINIQTIKMFVALFSVFCLQINAAAAGDHKRATGIKDEFVVTSLAPVIPNEADFNDAPVLPLYNDSALHPVIPNEASFNDSLTTVKVNPEQIRLLNPVLPVEATFEPGDTIACSVNLTPALPDTATFNEVI